MHHRCTQQQFVLDEPGETKFIIDTIQHFAVVVLKLRAEADIHVSRDVRRELLKAALALNEHPGLYPTADPDTQVALSGECQSRHNRPEEFVHGC